MSYLDWVFFAIFLTSFPFVSIYLDHRKREMFMQYSLTIKLLYCVVFLSLISIFSTGCCTPMQTRCSGQVLQICDSTHRWITHTDCSRGEPGDWSCVRDDSGECTCAQDTVLTDGIGEQ